MTAQFCQAAAEEYAASGKTIEAIEMFDQAARHDPTFSDINAHRLAVLHAEAGSSQQAATYFKKALELTPRSADIHNDYGFYLLSQGDLDSAESQFKEALSQVPNHARAKMNLGLLAARKGDINAAETQFATVIGVEAARENAAALAR